MYQVYIVPSLILISEGGFYIKDERFKQLAKESGTVLSLKEFEHSINIEQYNYKEFTLRILKPTKTKS